MSFLIVWLNSTDLVTSSRAFEVELAPRAVARDDWLTEKSVSMDRSDGLKSPTAATESR
jgi:hypothetical protein